MSSDRIDVICRMNLLPDLAERYILSCRADSVGSKRRERFPNLSGFCRFCGIGVTELSEIKKYPKKQVEYYYNAFMGNYAYIAYQNGVTLDTVLAQYGVDEARVKEMAEASCAEDLFYYALVQAHGLEVTDEEYDARVGEIAANQSMTVEELETEYGKEYIRDSMLYDEAILFVANAVNVNYVYVD